MIRDRDFTRVTFKVNTAGSWANLVTIDAERYDEAKAACVTLANAAGQRVRFKIVDAENGTIEEYGPNGYGQYDWHTPKRGRS